MLGLGAVLTQQDEQKKEFVVAFASRSNNAAESSKLTGKLARWALILQEYDFQVVHRAGVANLDADGLSRNPCTSQQDDTGAR
ncbi:unnamed protein product [Calypogeia fissa]